MTFLPMLAGPTEGDDTIEVEPGGLPTAEIDAGEGNDTILLKPTAQSSDFYIYDYSHKNFEFLQGTAAAETVHTNVDLLTSLKSFDGGGGGDKLVISLEWVRYPGNGYTLDLSHVDIRNTEISFTNFLSEHQLTLKFKDKETALAAKPGRYKAVVDFSETNVVFTLEERNKLFKNGFETVKDASGEYTYSQFVIGNFNREHQFIRPGDAPVYIDAGQDAALTHITPGGGILEVSAPFGTLGLDQTGAIRLEKDADDILHVMVDLTPDNGVEDRIDIGTIAKSSTSWSWIFNFNESATAYGIQAIIRNLTFQLDFPHDRAAYDGLIRINLTDAAGTSKDYFSTIHLLPQNADLLDVNENSAPATAGNDQFLALPDIFRGDYSLNGGGGTDTLYLSDPYANFDLRELAEFSGFERIVFHQYGGYLYINAEQLEGVDTITGADNSGGYTAEIVLVGDDRSTFDFQSKTVDGNFAIYFSPEYGTFLLNDKSLLLGLEASSGGFAEQGGLSAKRIHLVGNTFTAEERQNLLDMGFTDIWDDSDDGAGNSAPVIADLDGDTITVSDDETVALDVGSDAAFSDDGRIRKINVAVTGGTAADLLGFAESDVIELLDGLEDGGRIADAATGIVFANIYDVTHSSFEIMFNANATAERIDWLVRALTYTYGGTAEGWQREIVISASDQADKTTTAKVVVRDDDPPPEPNNAPRDIKLAGRIDGVWAAEGSTVIGALSATDGDGDPLTYTLGGDAGGRFEIVGGKVVVKNGARLDFETATSHTITVKVSDGKTIVSKDFFIRVGDVMESVLGATRGKNTLVGGIGADRLNGGYGNDKLTGGAGADHFVFSSTLGKSSSQNKKVNYDTITDFKHGQDKILLDNSIFTKLGKGSLAAPRALNRSFFEKTKADDRNDYLTYKSGVLSYDKDGSDKKYDPIAIIKIANNALLSAADFLVV